ncbi:MAG: alpha/beta fold hydrolase [Rhodanobacteraceae bacterium]
MRARVTSDFAMVRAEELRIDLAHLSLAAKAWGDGSLPPLLALHGWLDNAGSFDRLAPLLASERYVVALDLPGHGRSQHRAAGAHYHYVDYLDELREVFDRFEWKRAGLLGHSLGGALAAVFAAVYPGRVDELVLIEGLGPLTTRPDDALKQLRAGLLERAESSGNALRVYADAAAAAHARQRVNGLSEIAARTLTERGLKEVEGGCTWSSDPRLMLPSLQRYTEPQILAVLAGIRAPTLLILAEPETHLIGADAMSTRIAQVADIEVARLAGNHHLHLEHPQEVADAILPFLRKQSEKRREHRDAQTADDQSAGA